MTELVPEEDIERIVGVKRDPNVHWGRAVSAEQQVYILHPQWCLYCRPDLRDCPYSQALDRGITVEDDWDGCEDRPVPLWISEITGRLIPAHDSVDV
ncbi:MAG: hypothetical protein JOY78_20330 [Pseudonocardia sp.]|nr:hypothetical protein [Pseudonocardia sp.]